MSKATKFRLGALAAGGGQTQETLSRALDEFLRERLGMDVAVVVVEAIPEPSAT